MWGTTVSVASSSNFGPDWDDVDIDPRQPEYAGFFHPEPLFKKKTRHSTFGREQKVGRRQPKDDGYARVEASDTWTNRDANEKRLPRARVTQSFGKREVTPGPLDYDATSSKKAIQYRHSKAMVLGKHRIVTPFTVVHTPGPGAYDLPSQLDVAPVKKMLHKNFLEPNGMTIGELRAHMYQSPGPGKYRPDMTKISRIPVRARPVMRPKQRVAKSRTILDLRNLDILSDDTYAKETGVKFKGLRMAETSPGPGQYIDIMKEPRPDDGFKHTSLKDKLGVRRAYMVGGNNEVNPVGPGDYIQAPDFGCEDVRVKWSTSEIRSKMKLTTAVAGTVPWPELVSRADLNAIKSRQLAGSYTSTYSYPKHTTSMLKPMGSIRFKSIINTVPQFFDVSKATMKTK